MLDAARHHKHLAGFQIDAAVAEFDGHFTVDDDEYFVGIVVLVPDEFALQLDQLELVFVHLRNYARRPVLAELAQLSGGEKR